MLLRGQFFIYPSQKHEETFHENNLTLLGEGHSSILSHTGQ